MTTVLDEILDSLLPLRDQEIGHVRILGFDAAPSSNPDAGEDAVVVRVTLTNPTGDTWELDDTSKARAQVAKALSSTGIDAGDVVVQFVPEKPDYGDDK